MDKWPPTVNINEHLSKEEGKELPPRLVFYKSFGKYRFRLVGANNKKVAQSNPHGYKELRYAENTAITFVKIGIWNKRVYDLSIQREVLKRIGLSNGGHT